MTGSPSYLITRPWLQSCFPIPAVEELPSHPLLPAALRTAWDCSLRAPQSGAISRCLSREAIGFLIPAVAAALLRT